MQITFSNEELNPVKGLPCKRFGLFTIGADGRPDALRARFESYYELMSLPDLDARGCLVEVAHYAFISVDDFGKLFGPLPRPVMIDA